MKTKYFSLLIILFAIGLETIKAQNTKTVNPEPLIHTYLGNENRNYYGNKAPERLDLIWKLYLGEGVSPAYGNPNKIWKGAGWTGQPLYIREGDKNFLIIGAFDYNLKKINAETGEIVWEYAFDDIIKGSAAFCEISSQSDPQKKYVIIQGSRRGVKNPIDAEYCPSLRGISYLAGKELWRMNITKTDSYSRDVDGTALIVNDTAYLALENGLFTVFSPDPDKQEMRDGMLQPKIYRQIQYYNDEDITIRGDGLESESSPTLMNGVIYTPSGSGHVYGYSVSKGKNIFDLNLRTDLNGSAPRTNDDCLIIPVEKEGIAGPGGAMKIDPYKPADECVIWFYPTETKKWIHWQGGLIGSAAVNDAYITDNETHIAAFIDVAGWLHVVEHNAVEPNMKSLGPDGKTFYPVPKLLFKTKLKSGISSPIIVKDKLIAPVDGGIYLYKTDLENHRFTLLDSVMDLEIDATPIAADGKIFVAVRDGYLYCFGNKDE
jgi:outer membrane protein assembly factor BamB